MKIEFELKDKERILIIGIDEKGNRKQIGHIFTPSSSAESNLNAIQICGFDEAFDLWGCGVFGDKKTKQMKKDIQLCWFNAYDMMGSDEIRKVVIGEKVHHITEERMKLLGLKKPVWTETITEPRFSAVIDGKVCGKCFNYPCNCEVLINHENPFAVKREQDLYLEKKLK
ncbi:hypothetical protein LCGC14_0729970 [marine sediment metagenome]|uniref:Uncharacterized protein n=1 Tax=marine sediment metagenome TaxID=412755 RepID=A0A0F9SV74_9ZZZZ